METKGGDFYLGKIWGWVFPPAQVRQSPNCIPHHSQTVLFSQQPENENVTSLEHLLNSIAVLKQMAAWLTVLKREEYCSPGHSPCTQCCHLQYCLKPTLPTVEKDNHKVSPIFFYTYLGLFLPLQQDTHLFLHILEIWAEHLNENGHRPSLDDHTRLVGCSWGDVSQNPRCFKLQRQNVCHHTAEKHALFKSQGNSIKIARRLAEYTHSNSVSMCWERSMPDDSLSHCSDLRDMSAGCSSASRLCGSF